MTHHMPRYRYYGEEGCCYPEAKQKMIIAMLFFIMIAFINMIIAGMIHLKLHMCER
ncbi:hypothetical protein [Methanooceanicella nereidis]|uniref:hypothetical protein n=1 Tax=Methanooceanicella nereidis TaxID=2052831 RepID=UPI001E49615D|nr:hypothetical protein [Methanocella sp. CWC-04]